MSWSAPQSLGGPVLSWELMRGSRNRLMRICFFVYLGWLLLQFLFSFSPFDPPHHNPDDPRSRRVTNSELNRLEYSARLQFYNDHFFLLLHQQLVLVVVLTPALTAGALGQDKERGTLLALFTTEL